jgi:predicted DNA-binding protein (MmcQ/YjbR family)
MTLDQLRLTVLGFDHTTESFPFNETTLVFKVGGKMFLLVDVELPHKITLKSFPEKALDLIETNAWISPGFHMNKTHWITLDTSSEIASPHRIRPIAETGRSALPNRASGEAGT